jgi:hypothetical protein
MILGAALVGCGKGKSGAPAAPAPPVAPPGTPAPQHVSGTPHPDRVVDALRSAGLVPEGFMTLVPVPYGASYCEEGRVDTIDTVVCEYRDTSTLAQGKNVLLEQWGREGGHTGVAFETKLTLLGMYDRARHDPNGKTISKVVETFRKL